MRADARDVDIQVSGNLSTVSGNRKEQCEEKGKTWHRVERRIAAFPVQLYCLVGNRRCRRSSVSRWRLDHQAAKNRGGKSPQDQGKNLIIPLVANRCLRSGRGAIFRLAAVFLWAVGRRCIIWQTEYCWYPSKVPDLKRFIQSGIITLPLITVLVLLSRRFVPWPTRGPRRRTPRCRSANGDLPNRFGARRSFTVKALFSGRCRYWRPHVAAAAGAQANLENSPRGSERSLCRRQ